MKRMKGFQKYIGMMFKSKNTEPIYWDFEREVNVPIHTCFVFFPVRVVWKDKNAEVIEERIIKPWSCNQKPIKLFRYLEEYPL